MPSRILRESFVTSESVAAMPPAAQDRLPRYFLLADDFGCFLVQPAVIRGRIFPLRPDVTNEIVEQDIAAYAKAGIIEPYDGPGGKHYAWFPHWLDSQREPRATARRKCPAPPGAGQCPPKRAEAGQIPPQSQSSFPQSFSSQAQDPPVAPRKEPGGPAGTVLSLRIPKRQRRGPTTLAEDLRRQRDETRNERSKLLHSWIAECSRPKWDAELQREVPVDPPCRDEQLAWVQERCHASPEEAVDVVAIVEEAHRRATQC